MKQELSANQAATKQKFNVLIFSTNMARHRDHGTVLFFALTLNNFFTFSDISNVSRSVSVDIGALASQCP